MFRLFVAASLSDQTRQQIAAAVAPLRSSFPAASWTRAESFHLTFAFLGDQNEAIVEPVEAELRSRLADEKSFEILVTHCGFFPNERRPRVAWIGLEPRETLEHIAQSVRGALKAANIQFDEKPYIPHLTLARLREHWSPPHVAHFMRQLGEFRSAPARVDTVTLFQSQLSSKGAIHTPLRQIKLN